MKRTYQPKKRKRAKTHGFRARMSTRGGRAVLQRRRLSRSGEFDRVYRDGSSHATRYLVLYSFPRRDEEREEVRLGVSVSRKVGGSVDRNKVKRTLREAFWSLSERLPDKHDFVIVARADIGGLIEKEGMAGVTKSLEEAMDASFGGGRST